MPESLGARLRQQRERQQIGLRTVAEQTKIKLSLLEGLERDDLSRWPSGIFRRTYVRDYARAIGLPADEVARELLQLHPDPADVLSSPSGVLSHENGGAAGDGAPGRLRQTLGSIVSALSSRRTDATRNPMEARERAAAEHRQDQAGAPPCPDLRLVAELCTQLARTDRLTDRMPLLSDILAALGARGLILWLRDPDATKLKPVLSCGYHADVLGRLAPVGLEEVNATAVACRSARLCAVSGSDRTNGALAVPLMTPAGCGGVLALEFGPGGDAPTEAHRALATILAAQVARLIGSAGQEPCGRLSAQH